MGLFIPPTLSPSHKPYWVWLTPSFTTGPPLWRSPSCHPSHRTSWGCPTLPWHAELPLQEFPWLFNLCYLDTDISVDCSRLMSSPCPYHDITPGQVMRCKWEGWWQRGGQHKWGMKRWGLECWMLSLKSSWDEFPFLVSLFLAQPAWFSYCTSTVLQAAEPT